MTRDGERPSRGMRPTRDTSRVSRCLSVALPLLTALACAAHTRAAPAATHALLASVGWLTLAGVATNGAVFALAGPAGRVGGHLTQAGWAPWSTWISLTYQSLVFPCLALWRLSAQGSLLAWMRQPVAQSTRLDMVPHAMLASYMAKDLVTPWILSNAVLAHHVSCLVTTLGFASGRLRWGHGAFFAGVVVLEFGSLAVNLAVTYPESRRASELTVPVMAASNAISLAIMLWFVLGDGPAAALHDQEAPMRLARCALVIVQLPLVYIRGAVCAASRRAAAARFAKEHAG